MERPPRWEIDAMIPVSCVLIRQRRRETGGRADGRTDTVRYVRERENICVCVCVTMCMDGSKKRKTKNLKTANGDR